MQTNRPFELDSRIVHVWATRVQASESVVAQFRRVLSPDEARRATQFRLLHLERAFVLARGALRYLLGVYLGTPPGDVQFSYNSNGKPRLTEPGSIRFNSSHSGNLAVHALTLDCEIGVDVEEVRPLGNVHELASNMFCPEETAELMSLPVDQREHAFFLCWTRKEACVKALGQGLSVPLDTFRTTLKPGEPARMLHLAGDERAALTWTMQEPSLDSRYAIAVAYRAPPRSIQLWRHDDPAELFRLDARY